MCENVNNNFQEASLERKKCFKLVFYIIERNIVMHNENKNKSADPVPEAEVLRAAKAMPRVKNSTIANGGKNAPTNQREEGVSIGIDVKKYDE